MTTNLPPLRKDIIAEAIRAYAEENMIVMGTELALAMLHHIKLAAAIDAALPGGGVVTQRQMNEAFYVDVCRAEDRLKEFIKTATALLNTLPAHWHGEHDDELRILCHETDAVLNPHMHPAKFVEIATKNYGGDPVNHAATPQPPAARDPEKTELPCVCCRVAGPVTIGSCPVCTIKTADDIYEYCGADGSRWAATFRLMAVHLGYNDMDEWWLMVWFANAIERAVQVRCPQPQPPTETAGDIAVDGFAARMKAKMALKAKQGRGGWEDPERCKVEYLSQLLHEHVAKGDPVDVANLAMMLCLRGSRIHPAATAGEPVAWERFHPTEGWMAVREEDIPHYRAQGQEIRPLYAAPPAAIPAEVAEPAGDSELVKRLREKHTAGNSEATMKDWDKWRATIAKGYKGTWPRDAFESLLDYLVEDLPSAADRIEALAAENAALSRRIEGLEAERDRYRDAIEVMRNWDRDNLSDAEVGSIVRWHPTIRDALTQEKPDV